MVGQSKNYLKRKFCVLPFAIFVSFVQCYATTAIFIVTKNGIVAGADQLIYSVSFGGVRSAGEGTGSKIALIKDRFIVASLGVQSIDGAPPAYDFTSFIRTIESKITSDVSVPQLMLFIEDESARTFNAIGIEKAMRAGTIKRSDSIRCEFVEYVIAGYDSGVPMIFEVTYELDWYGYHLVGPIVKAIHPQQGHDAEFGFHVFGTVCSVADFAKPESYANKRALAYTPIAFKKLLARQPLSMVEGTDLVRVFISTQAEVNPSLVGPTATVITLPTNGVGTLTGYKNTPTLPTRAGRKKKDTEKAHQETATPN